MNHPLAPLLVTPQWIIVKLVPLANGDIDKLPVDPRTGRVTEKDTGGAHNPAMWLDYTTAAARAGSMPSHTVGFVITARDPFWCLDIDDARQPDGTWSLLAQQLCAALPGTAVEVSLSGTGLHVWGQGPVPPHAAKNVPLHLELYSQLRFIALGTGAVGDMSQPCPHIAAVVAQFFPFVEAAGEIPDEGARPEWRGPADDDEIIRRALQSRSATATFGIGASFADLWEANAAVLARCYPPDRNSSDLFDHSSADAALFQHLAFWTGCDQARMRRIAERSALKRDKWEREDYLRRTTKRAASLQRDVLQDKPPAAPPLLACTTPAPVAAPAAPAPWQPPQGPLGGDAVVTVAVMDPAASMRPRQSETYLSPAAQLEYFAGCVYVADHHKVSCPGGRLYPPDRFKAVYGGKVFVMDSQNNKTSKDAFEAFTQSLINECPVVDGTCFRPDLPYGAIVTTEGRRRVNTCWPAQVERREGDPGPLLRHIAKLFPNPADYWTLIYFMANCVQHPGHKAQWFPLLVGVEGNGKTLISQALAYAVGNRYTHWPATASIGGQFNAYLFGRLLLCLEDFKVPDEETMERLKPIVTGKKLAIENKGVDQRTEEVCCNLIANSNHKDAYRKTRNDRRVAPLWCAQHSVEELLRDGITEAAIQWLYGWFEEGGAAVFAHYLATLVIPPEFGLRWFKGRAPRTTATERAIDASRGRIEQEVAEQIEQGALGFRGGWVSSIALQRFLKDGSRTVVAPNKQRAIMQALGYDYHPALADGRVNTEVMPDGGKPRLYVQEGHPARQLVSPAEVAKAYQKAQGVGG